MATLEVRNKQPQVVRLLVVEDNPGYLHLIKTAFRSRSAVRWELTFAEDGQEALNLLFEEERTSAPLPDLILLDWNLPKVSGNEVLRRLKSHQKLRPVPGELIDHAAKGVWYNPRQCLRHLYESRRIGWAVCSTAGSGKRPSSPSCVR
jgi:CheY-like chemotaxis protein